MPSDLLSREQIVQAAIELLDADGVDGLSMRRLGTKLGSGATSLYWYVKNKDDLVSLAVDEAIGEIERPDPAESGWRAAAVTTARSMRATMVRHPWLSLVLISHPTDGPKMARFTDHMLAVFEETGLRDADLEWTSSAYFAYVFGMTIGEVGEVTWRARLRAAGIDEDQHVAEVVARFRETASEFPRLLKRYDAVSAMDPDEVRDSSFEYGLDIFLEGIAAKA